MIEEQAKAKRAEFGKLCHAKYLYYFITLVMPFEGRHARETLHLDIRTMDEFIKSLDVSQAGYTQSSSLPPQCRQQCDVSLSAQCCSAPLWGEKEMQ